MSKPATASPVRVSMSRVVAGWGYGAAFANITSGAVYTAFARALGANDFAFGVLAAALPALATAAGSKTSSTKRRKCRSAASLSSSVAIAPRR